MRLAGPHGELDVLVQVRRVDADVLTCARPGPGHFFSYRPVRISAVGE